MHNETGIGNVFVAETVGELVADFGRGAVAVGAGQGELQIFLRGSSAAFALMVPAGSTASMAMATSSPLSLRISVFAVARRNIVVISRLSSLRQVSFRTDTGGSSVFFGAVGFFTAYYL